MFSLVLVSYFGIVAAPQAVAKAIHPSGWYVNLGDVCFWLKSDADGQHDLYWVSRESALLIRGGANYAYDQINDELSSWVSQTFGLQPGLDFVLVVVGLRLKSEHDDDCCVTIELFEQGPSVRAYDGGASALKTAIRAKFLSGAKQACSKGAAPDRLRFGAVSRNFKGAVLTKELAQAWKDHGGNDDAQLK